MAFYAFNAFSPKHKKCEIVKQSILVLSLLLLYAFCWVEATGVTRIYNLLERKTRLKGGYGGKDHGVRGVGIVREGRRMKLVKTTPDTDINAALYPVPCSEDTPIRTMTPAHKIVVFWHC